MKKIVKMIALIVVLAMSVGIITVFAAEGEEVEKQTVKIGIITCFSGTSAEDAEAQLTGLQVAMNQVEEKGLSKYYDFELVKGDDKFDATEAVSVANKLVYQDDVKAVFGHLAAFVTLAGVGVYEEAQIPCLTPSCSSLQLIENGYQYVYLTVPHDKVSAPSIVKYLVEDLGQTKLGVLYCDNEQGQTGLGLLEEVLTEHNLEFLDKESFAVDDTDYTGQLLNFKAAGIETLLVWGGDSSRRAIMVDQIRQYLGEDLIISGDNYFDDIVFYNQTTPEERSGIIYPSAWSERFTDEASAEYVKDFRELLPEAGSIGAYTVRMYDGFYMLVEALNEMGPYDVNADDFTVKLNEALKNVKVEGLQGTLEPMENGECLLGTHIVMYDETGSEVVVK